ncbi:MAG: hypothetical protein M5U08_08460 [Burkholderiales bacterium]|nr:hypothetical protein [Burkholderiales bacterium]
MDTKVAPPGSAAAVASTASSAIRSPQSPPAASVAHSARDASVPAGEDAHGAPARYEERLATLGPER